MVELMNQVHYHIQFKKKKSLNVQGLTDSLIVSPDKARKDNEWNPTTKRKSLTPSLNEEATEQNGNNHSSDEESYQNNEDDDDDISDDPVSEHIFKMAPLSSISEVTLNTI